MPLGHISFSSHAAASPSTRRAPAWRCAASRPTQQAPAWWHADLREDSATAPTQQPASQHGTTRLASSEARRSQARRRHLGRASFPSPIKQEGYVGSALNVFCPTVPKDRLDHHIAFHLLCATVASPLAIKGGPRRTEGGFGFFGRRTHRS